MSINITSGKPPTEKCRLTWNNITMRQKSNQTSDSLWIPKPIRLDPPRPRNRNRKPNRTHNFKSRNPYKVCVFFFVWSEMEALPEDEEYTFREVVLPSLIPVVPEPELERETGERRRGRDVIVAVDHGPNSKHAFDWALVHFCRIADTLHLVHAVSSSFSLTLL